MRPVGGDARGRRSTSRIVAATNRDLETDGRGAALPRGPLLPAQRDPHRRCRRCARAATTCCCSRSTSSSSFAARGRQAGRRALAGRRPSGCCAYALAGQRARAGELHRARGRADALRRRSPSRTCPRRSATTGARTCCVAERRPGRAASRWTRWSGATSCACSRRSAATRRCAARDPRPRPQDALPRLRRSPARADAGRDAGLRAVRRRHLHQAEDRGLPGRHQRPGHGHHPLPGQAAEEVEKQVTIPVERALIGRAARARSSGRSRRSACRR